MMHKYIFLWVLVAAVTCQAQFPLNRPQTQAGSFSRQPHFLDPQVPIQNVLNQQEPQHVRVNIPLLRKPVNTAASVLSGDDESLDYEVYTKQNAKYQFSSNIEDHINDQTQQREEVRDGNSVKGSYSYSDGYYKRTVNYIADENGYRVTGMEAIPLDGPHIDLKGTASVSSSAHGTQLKYKVASVPIPKETLN